jgi:pimeloyl-ACP methyl ester carboxylesterase
MGLLGGAALTLGGLALYNGWKARRAEAANPPVGRFVEAAGVRVHYVDTAPGAADAVVLIHGNVVTLQDWLASGVIGALAGRRVLVFDRPGFGYSERPDDTVWGPLEQARLLAAACRQLGVTRPVVVGQSWGAMVALAWAVEAGPAIAGSVLISGYYYPRTRADALFVAPAAAPIIGPLLRNTVSPPFTRASMGRVANAMFAPQPVPQRFWDLMPIELFSRPGQLRAIASDGAMMQEEAARLGPHIGPLGAPTAVLVGADDKVVEPRGHSIRLARETGATLDVLPGVGHMAHWAAPDLVAERIEPMLAAAARPSAVPSTGLRP